MAQWIYIGHRSLDYCVVGVNGGSQVVLFPLAFTLRSVWKCQLWLKISNMTAGDGTVARVERVDYKWRELVNSILSLVDLQGDESLASTWCHTRSLASRPLCPPLRPIRRPFEVFTCVSLLHSYHEQPEVIHDSREGLIQRPKEAAVRQRNRRASFVLPTPQREGPHYVQFMEYCFLFRYNGIYNAVWWWLWCELKRSRTTHQKQAPCRR